MNACMAATPGGSKLPEVLSDLEDYLPTVCWIDSAELTTDGLPIGVGL